MIHYDSGDFVKVGVFGNVRGDRAYLERLLEEMLEERAEHVYCLGNAISDGATGKDATCLRMLRARGIHLVRGSNETWLAKKIRKDDIALSAALKERNMTNYLQHLPHSILSQFYFVSALGFDKVANDVQKKASEKAVQEFDAFRRFKHDYSEMWEDRAGSDIYVAFLGGSQVPSITRFSDEEIHELNAGDEHILNPAALYIVKPSYGNTRSGRTYAVFDTGSRKLRIKTIS